MEPQPPRSPQPPPPPPAQAPARRLNLLSLGVVIAIALGAVSLGYSVVGHVQDQQSAASSAAQLNWMRNTLASDNNTLGLLEPADVSATSGYFASGCAFTAPQLFDISVTYANFGTTEALGTTFTTTVSYSGGGSQSFTYLLGSVPGRYLGSFAKEYTLNSCNAVTGVYLSWTWQ